MDADDEVTDAPRAGLDAVREAAGIHSRVSLPPDDSGAPVVDSVSTARHEEHHVDQYRLLGEVARGGVGIIMRGHDVDLGRDVAMKVLRPDHADRPTMIQRFIEEAQIGGQLQHPGIVPVYEVGTRSDGRPFFTMKLVKGRTLAQLLKESKRGAGERGRFLAIFADICQTMAYAHSKRVIHRDLKPANVMVGAFGEVLVVDWGLAKVLDRGRDAQRAANVSRPSEVSVVETIRSSGDTSDSDSMSGSVIGTPAYMAPEQARGLIEDVGPRADVFALGCVLCEMLTGAPPYEGESGREVLDKAARADLGPAFARLDVCGADAELVRMCRDSLAPAIDARPRDAGALAEAMDAYLASVEERAHRAVVEAAESRQKRRVTLIGAVATLALLSGAWWTTARQADQTRRTDTAIERQLGESEVLEASGSFAAALAAIERAEELARTGTASPERTPLVAKRRAHLEELLETRAFLDELAAISSRAATAADVEVSDETPTDTIDAMRRDRMLALDAEFRASFLELGDDLLALSLPDAVTLVRDSGHAVELCAALDAWSANQRGLGGLRDSVARQLLQIALAADPHPDRMALRQALLALDVDALRELAAAADVAEMSDVTAKLMASALIQLDAHVAALDLLRVVLRAHRGDLTLNLLAATALKRIGRIEQAVAPLNAALAIQPARLVTMLELGDAHLAAADFELAEIVLRDAAELHPEACDPWMRLAQVFGRSGRDAERVEALRVAAELEPARPDVQAVRLETFYAHHGGRATNAALDELVVEAHGDADVLSAIAAGTRGVPSVPLSREVEILEQVVSLDPRNSDAWRRLARARRDARDLEGALEAVETSLSIQPAFAFSLALRGGLRASLAGDSRVGLEDLRRAVHVAEPDAGLAQWYIGALSDAFDEYGDDVALPDDVWMRLARSEHALRQLDLDAAESLARDAVRMAPDLWPAHAQRAYIVGKRRGKRDEAIAFYEELIRRRPDHLFALTNVATRYIEAGDLDAAYLALGRSVGYARHPARLAHLGEVLWRLERQDEARRLFDEALWRIDGRLAPNMLYANRTIARCLAIDPQAPRRQLEEAEALAWTYARAWDERDDAHEVLGLVYLRLGRMTLARDSLKRAQERQADGVTAMTAFLFALVELHDNDRDEAVRWLQRGVKIVDDEHIADPFVLGLVPEAMAILKG